ncbi:RAS guanyl-releasing protein 2-like, partial [Haliaeetus albicilla]|uniref:RAS guanyl-releasing protein 2-like n=1 Tax=Haliaeetus albicilla TaxID=8969 RepID=UPI0037E7C6A5
VSLELGQTEEQLYQLSLQLGAPPGAAPVCPMDEWVLPDPPKPDPALLRAHLERLVESIFRNFDVDGDGRISREEFGIVRENFPHLRLFGDLDTDRDGSLSRGEVLAYFLRCSEGPPPAPPGPPHHFEESSPLRPAACRHCRRLILGLHKQGLKCRTCGLRCHARCRERLRVECRRRTQSVASDAPPGPPGPPPRSFSFSLPRPRRSSSALHPPETPEELQEVEDGVFDIHL